MDIKGKSNMSVKGKRSSKKSDGGFAMSAVLCGLALFMTVSVLVLSSAVSYAESAVSRRNEALCMVAVSSAADMICDVLISESEAFEDDIRAYVKGEIGEGAVRDGGGSWKRYVSSDEKRDEAVRSFSMEIPDSSDKVFFDMYWECPNYAEKEIPQIILSVFVYASRQNEEYRKELRFIRQTDAVYTDDYLDSDSEWRWYLYEE